MKVAFFIFLALILHTVPSAGQKSRKPRKQPIIRETVTVKGGPYIAPKYPDETEADLWKEHAINGGSIKLTFPSGSGKYLHDGSEELPDGPTLVSVSATTKNASYQLLTRPVAPLLSNPDIEDVLETSISSVFSKTNTQIISKKNVYYAGFIGKELVISTTRAEGKEIQHARVFLLSGTLIAMYVTLDDPNSGKAMQPWITKFFESLVVRLPARNDA